MEASFEGQAEQLLRIPRPGRWHGRSQDFIIGSRDWPVEAAETKQIDNFQLNLNGVSTEPTESTAPLKRLSYASLELWPLLRLTTALVSLGSARSLFLPTSLVTAAGSTCQQPARDILRHQVKSSVTNCRATADAARGRRNMHLQTIFT